MSSVDSTFLSNVNPRTDIELEQLIEQTYQWVPYKDGFTCFLMDDSETWISHVDLARIHKDLPNFINIAVHNDKISINHVGVNGDIVDETLKLWSGSEHHVIDVAGDTRVLSSIRDIDISFDDVIFYAEAFTTDICEGLFNEVKYSYVYATDCYSDIVVTSLDWMNTTYPDWQKQWALIKDLDVEKSLRPSLLLKKSIVLDQSPTSIPNDF